MSTAAVLRRLRIRRDLAAAFPEATWTISREEVRGRFGPIVVSLAVLDLYGKRGCSDVTVHPFRTSSTWNATGRATPRSGTSRSVIAAVRRALQVTAAGAPAARAAEQLLANALGLGPRDPSEGPTPCASCGHAVPGHFTGCAFAR